MSLAEILVFIMNNWCILSGHEDSKDYRYILNRPVVRTHLVDIITLLKLINVLKLIIH